MSNFYRLIFLQIIFYETNKQQQQNVTKNELKKPTKVLKINK